MCANPGRRVAVASKFCTVEHTLCHHSGAHNFEVAFRFLEKNASLYVTDMFILVINQLDAKKFILQ